MLRVLWHTLLVVLLTVFTQLGGIAWLLALLLSRYRAGTFLALFILIYGGFWMGARIAAPELGRVAVPCIDPGPGHASALSPLFCAMNRTYLTLDAAAVAEDLADRMESRFPGTRTRVLDAGFPFLDGFPLVPHLSHDDGNKFDLALWYEGGGTRSPIGYFAFEEPRPNDPQPCNTSGALRWDLDWLQPYFPDIPLDEIRTAEALRWLSGNLPPDGKVFIEPHLAQRLGVEGPNIRFQGCAAARHDDHIHVQLR